MGVVMALTPAPNWTQIVHEHGSLVLRLCSRSTHDPEDAYQEAWSRIFSHFHRYDPDRGTLKGWIGTVTRHYLVDRFRRERSRGQVIPLVDQQVASGDCPERTVFDRLRRERLEAAIQRLPPEQRHVVLMHHLHGIPLAQLAAEVGVALGTIKSRLHRGRAGLTHFLRGEP